MPSNDVITPEAFNTLLDWLDPDRNEAARIYESIRNGLIAMFITRGSIEAESLADLTIDRVTLKLPKVLDNFTGEKAKFFHGVARNIFLEHVRTRREDPVDIDRAPEVLPDPDKEIECLNDCLKKLSPEQSLLVLEYFLEDGKRKAEHRKALAEELHIDPGTLRTKVHRIKDLLANCVRKALGIKKK
jgi:DNA-directed RNA polymerase specialized sigma24 family protein